MTATTHKISHWIHNRWVQLGLVALLALSIGTQLGTTKTVTVTHTQQVPVTHTITKTKLATPPSCKIAIEMLNTAGGQSNTAAIHLFRVLQGGSTSELVAATAQEKKATATLHAATPYVAECFKH